MTKKEIFARITEELEELVNMKRAHLELAEEDKNDRVKDRHYTNVRNYNIKIQEVVDVCHRILGPKYTKILIINDVESNTTMIDNIKKCYD